LGQMRGEGVLDVSAGELGLDSRELRRETVRLAAVGVLRRMGPSRRRPLGSSDKLPAVDGPVAKSETRDRLNWLAAHEGACFLPEPEAGTQLSAGWDPSSVRGVTTLSHRREVKESRKIL
jgi:hypothetical protein